MLTDKNISYYNRLEVGDKVIIACLGVERVDIITTIERKYVSTRMGRYKKSTGLRVDSRIHEYLIESIEEEILAAELANESAKLARTIKVSNLESRLPELLNKILALLESN